MRHHTAEGEYGLLINAMQLSLATPIAGFLAADTGILRIKFKSTPRQDKGFGYLQRLLKGEWAGGDLSFAIKIPGDLFLRQLTNFLMLSRLQEKNMRTLARLDPQYQPFVQKIFGGSIRASEAVVYDPKQAADIIFEQVKKQKMTIRELSQKSGLTQVTLSNFKVGRDIRFSTLLRILKTLKLSLMIRT